MAVVHQCVERRGGHLGDQAGGNAGGQEGKAARCDGRLLCARFILAWGLVSDSSATRELHCQQGGGICRAGAPGRVVY